MDLHERINSCPSFGAGKCPHQPLMERAYLIPQLMKPEDLETCERLLCTCDCGVTSRRAVALPFEGLERSADW
jgi:hypothetical protein